MIFGWIYLGLSVSFVVGWYLRGFLDEGIWYGRGWIDRGRFESGRGCPECGNASFIEESDGKHLSCFQCGHVVDKI